MKTKTYMLEFKPKLLVLALTAAFAQPTMADSYWACGTGNWNSKCWSTTSGGTATVTDPISTTFGDIYVIQSGTTNKTVTFNPTSASLTSLTVDATGTGTMTLSQSANALTSFNEYIGELGTGSFTQSGGTNTVNGGVIVLGYIYQSGTGTYTLSGGTLNGNYEVIGYDGNGTFTQTNGTNNASLLAIDINDGSSSSGTYN
jgi:hypothetical protein